MNIPVNTEIISKFFPCEDKFDNWKRHYLNFNGDLLEFLDLPKITHSDKLWVALRLLPRFEVEVFAIECAIDARDASAAAFASYAADAAAAAADAYAAFAAAAADAAVDTAAFASYAADAADAVFADFAADDYADGPRAARAKARANQIEILKYLAENVGKA